MKEKIDVTDKSNGIHIQDNFNQMFVWYSLCSLEHVLWEDPKDINDTFIIKLT